MNILNDRTNEELRKQTEWLRITLSSIGDAVISTDAHGAITFMNSVAEHLTGWSQADALSLPLPQVFHIVNEHTRQKADNPALRALKEGNIVGLANHTILIARDGTERPIDDSAAPIRVGSDAPIGAVLVFRDVTERKRAEETQARLAAIIESSEDAIISKNLMGIIKSWNAGAERLFGYTASEMIGQPVTILIPPDRQVEETQILERIRKGERVPAYDTVRLAKDGSRLHISLSVSPIKDRDGHIIGASKVARNISERIKSEAELRRSEGRLRRLASAGIIGVIRWNLETNLIVEANDEFLRMTGYDHSDIAAGRLNFRTMTPPEWTSRNEIGIHDLRTKGVGGAYEKEYYRKDGSRVPIIIAGVRFEDSSNEGMSFVLDITDRKQSDRILARMTADSERRRRLYETIHASTPDFIYVFGLDHRFTYANHALLTMWRKTWDEAIGKNCLELGYPEWHAAMHDREIDHVISTKTPIRGEVAFSGAHGVRQYDYIFAPVIGVDGEVEAIAGTTRDITERIQAEEELIAIDRKKDEFIALLAHELRNPLAPLRNGLQILKMPQIDPDISTQARNMMDRQLAHMIRLIDDLLDIARINQNKMELRKAQTALADIISSAVETARPAIDNAGHTLTISLPDESIILDADLVRLAQVFSNLLMNSAKYTERGGHIWLTAERHRGEVNIKVRDTGIGIPAYALPKIFDMFSQVDRSIERSTGGLGIGLALVKGLVEMHGGKVQAESLGQGMGSTFTVILPVVITESNQAVDQNHSSQGKDATRRRILVVDDNQDAASSMALMLELMNNEVQTAHDGLAALEIAEQFQPQLILMDIGMPRLNGYETTRRLRQLPWGKAIIIIALTGWGQEEDKVKTREAGCNGHIVKPVSLPELEKLLSELT